MKEIIIALLTIAVNRYERAKVDSLSKRSIINDLTDILDYVEDIQEEKINTIQTTFHENSNEELLRKRIRELEDSCENFVEVERNLLNRKEVLEDTIRAALPFLPQGYRDNIKTVLEGK